VKTTAVTVSILQAAAEQLHRIKAMPASVTGAMAAAATLHAAVDSLCAVIAML